jgi:hypothetical protein
MTLSGEQLDAALLGVANSVDRKSPYMLGHASAVAKLAGISGATLGLDNGEVELLPRPRWSVAWAGWASRIRSGISPARSAPASRNGCACSHT